MAATHQAPAQGDSLVLPPGTRLLYIGPPKTGTTSLQFAASQARHVMAEHGVCYPGTGLNHRRAIYALMDRLDAPIGNIPRGLSRADAMKVPPLTEWRALMEEVDAHPSWRALISNEVAAGADEAMIETFLTELGRDRTHIAISLRSPSSLLPARWVEMLKSGEASTLDAWLQRVYGRSEPPVPAALHRYLDMGGLVQRWAQAVGPENVTVIIGDKANKDLLTDTFEHLLDLPAGTLTGTVSGGRRTNRSMTRTEAELFRRFNEYLRHSENVSWPLYLDVIRAGAVGHLLGQRAITDDEPPVQMPPWAAELALRDGKAYADSIIRSGVRVVGSVDALHPEPRPIDPADDPTLEQSATFAIAVDALIGAWKGASSAEADAVRRIDRAQQGSRAAAAERDKIRKKLGEQRVRSISAEWRGMPADRRAQRIAESASTRDLLRAVAVRLRHKARTRTSMPLQ